MKEGVKIACHAYRAAIGEASYQASAKLCKPDKTLPSGRQISMASE
jgi:hypothetical protein